MSSSKRILIAVTSHNRYDGSTDATGYWLEEITHFYEGVVAAGYAVDFVSPAGGKPPMDPKSGSVRDAANKAFLSDARLRTQLDNTRTPAQVEADDYVAIYYAGGHGAMWDFPENQRLNEIAQRIYANRGVVSAICHGVAGLLNLKDASGAYLIANQPVTGFSNLEEGLIFRKKNVPFLLEDELKTRGAVFKKALLPFTPSVVVGDRLLTGQNPQSGKALGKAFAELMKTNGRRS